MTRTDRGIVAAAIVGSAAPFTPQALDETMLLKATVAVVAVAALALRAMSRAVAVGRLAVPVGPGPAALVAFAAAMVLATVASPQPVVSAVGLHGRFNGALLHLAAAGLALAILAAHRRRDGAGIAGWLLVAGATVTTYGILQLVGLDPVPWQDTFGEAVIAQLGNPDFVAGYLGIVVPLAVWGAAWPAWPVAARLGSLLLAVAAAVVIVGTGTEQGFAAAGAGLTVLASGWWLSARGGEVARRLPLLLAGAGGLAAVLSLAGVLGHGPLALLSRVPTMQSRLRLWRTALAMFGGHPLTGVGPGRYRAGYHRYRPLEEALERDLSETADAAHNVALDLFAGGGLLVGLAWLALVAVVAWAWAAGWRDGDPPRRRLLSGLGGAYVAYQTQAAVSLDVPPLLVAHFLLAGAILVASGTVRWRSWHLGPPRPLLRHLWWPLAAVAVGLAVVPLYADHVAGRGAGSVDEQGPVRAADRLGRAAALVPWELEYPFRRGEILAAADRTGEALAAMEETLRRAPWDFASLVSRGRLLHDQGRLAAAVEAYAAAERAAPHTPELAVEHAAALVDAGDREAGCRRAAEVLELAPDTTSARRLLRVARCGAARP